MKPDTRVDPLIGLDISTHETLVTLPGGAVMVLPIGTASLWAPSAEGPTALAVEKGIQIAEDAIERVAANLPQGASLLLSRRSWAPLQRRGDADAASKGAMDLADIEREYQWLAARAVGAPSARGSGFDDPAGDATVLILRECMHHLGLPALRFAS